MGHGCTPSMDPAHMGELVAQEATKAWKLNVIITTQRNWYVLDVALVTAKQALLKRGIYEFKFFVHHMLPLCVALWAENITVTALVDYHSPVLLTK